MKSVYNHPTEKIPVHNNAFDMSDPNFYRGSDGLFHYCYKIVNLVNRKYYYGIHSTDNLDDNYKGSGTVIHQAYKKYGIENFLRYYVRFFDDRKSLLEYEKEIVNSERLQSPLCYNLALGGKGSIHLNTKTTKGRIRVNNGVLNKVIEPNLLDEYLNNGWVLGQTQRANTGKMIIHKEQKELFIYPEELEEYIENGWERGALSRNKGTTSHAKEKFWINDGTVCKRVCIEELEGYLKSGWTRGSIQRTIKNYIRITDGTRDKNIPPDKPKLLQYYLDQGWRRGSHTKHDDKCWISKGNESKRILKEELQQYIDQGWKRGNVNINRIQTITNAGKIAITSPDKHIKYVNPEDLQKYLDQGYTKGNIFNKRPSTNKGDIRVNNGEISKSIKLEDLQKYLDLGWKRGNIHKIVTKGRYRITNGKEERFVTPEEFETLDHSIWQRGLTRSRKSKK